MTDIAIVGAGPAGAAAAITACRAGLSVEVFEKGDAGRDKTCGDGLTTAALRHLDELGVDHQLIEGFHAVSQVAVAGPNGRTTEFSLPADRGLFAAVAKRQHLDQHLLECAIDAGAKVHTGTALTAIEQGATSVTLRTASQSATASYVIAADGMYSTTRKLLTPNATRDLGTWHGFRQYFENVDGRYAKQLYVSFEEDLLPGYFWSFPLGDGTANVGFGIQRGGGYRTQEMRYLWQDLLSRPNIVDAIGPSATPVEAHRAWPIPASVDEATYSIGRVLFSGDAIGACDPMSGEGIAQALLTGSEAARSIADSIADPTRVAQSYEASVTGHLVADHKMSMTLIRALSTRRGTSWALAAAGATDWTRRNFVRWLFEDYPRAALFTPRRWHRRMFTSDGAYNSQA